MNFYNDSIIITNPTDGFGYILQRPTTYKEEKTMKELNFNNILDELKSIAEDYAVTKARLRIAEETLKKEGYSLNTNSNNLYEWRLYPSWDVDQKKIDEAARRKLKELGYGLETIWDGTNISKVIWKSKEQSVKDDKPTSKEADSYFSTSNDQFPTLLRDFLTKASKLFPKYLRVSVSVKNKDGEEILYFN